MTGEMRARALRGSAARAPALLACLAAAAWVASNTVERNFVGTGVSAPRRARGAVALGAGEPAPAYVCDAAVKTFGGWTYKPSAIPSLRLRMHRYGQRHDPRYRIYATRGNMKAGPTPNFLEKVGWFHPTVGFHNDRMFRIKADRAVFWLRAGAQPTDQVASLLDYCGIIRRTGPLAVRGEWEWRVPMDSGPQAPEGWKWDGPQQVDWENRPQIQTLRQNVFTEFGAPAKPEVEPPLIEQNDFVDYLKIPMDEEIASEPFDGSSMSTNGFSNTDLPIPW